MSGWDVALSESSSDSDGEGQSGQICPKPARIMTTRRPSRQVSLLDHDYCREAYLAALAPPPLPEPQEDLSEMGKILSDVAIGATEPVRPLLLSHFLYVRYKIYLCFTAIQGGRYQEGEEEEEKEEEEEEEEGEAWPFEWG